MKNWALLVAEDDDNDFFILQRAILKAEFPYPVLRVRNGQEAIDYLSGESPYSDRIAYPVPTVFLMDLKMPLKHGFDVLKWLRSESQAPVRHLPTIILSSTNRPDDIGRGYELGANAFVTKPTTTQAMTDTVRAIDYFWIRQNCFRYLKI